MRKNGSRLISYSQYRMTDLFLFALILGLAELLEFFAAVWFPQVALYTFSLMLPITLIVMMRWGWVSVFYAAASGLIYCLLHNGEAGAAQYVSYIFGNACIAAVLIFVKLVGKKKIAGKWYLSAVMVIIGWVLIILGRSVLFTAFGFNFVVTFAQLVGLSDCGFLTLIMAVVVVLVMRRFDGIFEDQKSYLLRLDEERKEKMRRDTYGDEPIEIDEESLSILNKHDDNGLY